MTKKEVHNPFGINPTKRYVSSGGEAVLFNKYYVGNSGSVELVDYMGGDDTVERVATAGHGRVIVQPHLDQDIFISSLGYKGILQPFKSVQLKFSIQSPIEVALDFVYEPGVNINEYSLRYSQALETSQVTSVEELQSHMPREDAEMVYELMRKSRETSFASYLELVGGNINMARELARTALGIDQDTKYFWKIDLPSLANFSRRIRARSNSSLSIDYLEAVEEIAMKVAPFSWNILRSNNLSSDYPLEFTMPRDNMIVDSSLSPASWGASDTKRVVVPAVEEKLFSIEDVLNHGEFQVVDYMGDDNSMAEAARVSYGEGTKTLQDNANLVRSLIRDLHTSPIEMAELAFESRVPLFTDPRQAGRHRTLDWHSFMGYIPLGDKFYFPDDSQFKHQDKVSRQGRGKEMDDEERVWAKGILIETLGYQHLLADNLRMQGVPEEIVRRVKGVGFYTKIWRTGDTHNLLHFLRLRDHSHAQYEVREFAQRVREAVKAHTPIAYEAFETYRKNGISLSTKEAGVLSRLISGSSLSSVDLDDLEVYKEAGFVIKDKSDPAGEERVLGREGLEFREKLVRLLGK